jgi:hypothetical protein
VDEVTAKDFIMVRAALVKRLGGANEALVWSRIEYRASSAQHAHEADGMHWWAASYEVIADEVGLSRDQVKRVVGKLVDGGFLVAAKHHGSLQTMSYRPVIIHRADSPYGSVPSGDIALVPGRNRPMTGADSPDAPLKDIEDVKDTPVVPKGTDVVDVAFDRVWELWPSNRRVTRKKSGASFRTAVKAHGGLSRLDELVRVIGEHCAVWAGWPEADKQFVPSMTTWLNQERWTMPLPQPRGSRSVVDVGRQVDAMLRAEQESRKAVAS